MRLYWPKLEQIKINYNEKLPLKNSALIRVGIEEGWRRLKKYKFVGFVQGFWRRFQGEDNNGKQQCIHEGLCTNFVGLKKIEA